MALPAAFFFGAASGDSLLASRAALAFCPIADTFCSRHIFCVVLRLRIGQRGRIWLPARDGGVASAHGALVASSCASQITRLAPFAGASGWHRVFFFITDFPIQIFVLLELACHCAIHHV